MYAVESLEPPAMHFAIHSQYSLFDNITRSIIPIHRQLYSSTTTANLHMQGTLPPFNISRYWSGKTAVRKAHLPSKSALWRYIGTLSLVLRDQTAYVPCKDCGACVAAMVELYISNPLQWPIGLRSHAYRTMERDVAWPFSAAKHVIRHVRVWSTAYTTSLHWRLNVVSV